MEFEKTDIQTIASLLQFFKGDIDKTTQWLNTPIEEFDGASPGDMISHGMSKKLWEYVEAGKYL